MTCVARTDPVICEIGLNGTCGRLSANWFGSRGKASPPANFSGSGPSQQKQSCENTTRALTDYREPIVYPFAITRSGDTSEAHDLMDFIVGTDGLAIFSKLGSPHNAVNRHERSV